MNPSSTHEDDPGLDGPDYVALVIEWDDEEEEITKVSASAPQPPLLRHTIVTVLGAVAALALAMWGLRRLRTA
jgi:hypothetical protein